MCVCVRKENSCQQVCQGPQIEALTFGSQWVWWSHLSASELHPESVSCGAAAPTSLQTPLLLFHRED